MARWDKVLMSTAYLPPVNYFAIVAGANEVVIEQYETYPRQTYRNRCEIYSPNGKIPLIIPVHKPSGNHTMTKDIVISEHEKWQKLHWRAIRTTYANSPFFLYYQDDLLSFYENKHQNLLRFNTELFSTLLSLAGLKTKISYTTGFVKDPEGLKDFRWTISPKKDFNIFLPEPYYQTFNEKHGFINNLSIIDLLFNLGPETRDYLHALVFSGEK